MPVRTRRRLLTAGAAVAVGGAAARLFGPWSFGAVAAPAPAPTTAFPSQDPADVQAVVGAAHNDLDQVRALVTARPALAKAAWDWGFGDWESALGAASHMGRRDIAELLIAHGARPTIFSAAMLGQLEVVQAFVNASPGVQGIAGPHGIPLLDHARRGGEQAAPVVAYLTGIGGADIVPPVIELSEGERSGLVGRYRFGEGADDALEVYESRGRLMLRRGERAGRPLHALGRREFHPAGAQAVRIRFTPADDEPAATLTVWDPGLVLTARRA